TASAENGALGRGRVVVGRLVGRGQGRLEPPLGLCFLAGQEQSEAEVVVGHGELDAVVRGARIGREVLSRGHGLTGSANRVRPAPGPMQNLSPYGHLVGAMSAVLRVAGIVESEAVE